MNGKSHSKRSRFVTTVVACVLAFTLAGTRVASAQNTILTPNVGVGTSSPLYFMDINGGGGGGIGSPPGLNIRVPNGAGQFNGFRFSTATGDGSIAGFAGEVVTGGSYPTSVGRGHFWVQNGPMTQEVAIFSTQGLLVFGGGGGGLGTAAGLTLGVTNTVGQYNGLRFSTNGVDGSLAGVHAEVITAGAFPSSQGRLHLWAQDGNLSRDVVTISPTLVAITGDVTVSGNIAAKYQDVAEWVPTIEKISPATVVVIDPSRGNHVLPASAPYDQRVAGVISERPGVILGEGGDDRVKVAHSGRVKVKVDARYGSIAAGDLLVTSATPGYAMRSEPLKIGDVQMHRPGTLIGKALEPLAEGQGEILVLLLLQ
jgi:hypothetical protein